MISTLSNRVNQPALGGRISASSPSGIGTVIPMENGMTRVHDVAQSQLVRDDNRGPRLKRATRSKQMCHWKTAWSWREKLARSRGWIWKPSVLQAPTSGVQTPSATISSPRKRNVCLVKREQGAEEDQRRQKDIETSQRIFTVAAHLRSTSPPVISLSRALRIKDRKLEITRGMSVSKIDTLCVLRPKTSRRDHRRMKHDRRCARARAKDLDDDSTPSDLMQGT